MAKLKTSNFIQSFALRWAWWHSRNLFIFSEINDNILEMVQDRDIATMEDY